MEYRQDSDYALLMGLVTDPGHKCSRKMRRLNAERDGKKAEEIDPAAVMQSDDEPDDMVDVHQISTLGISTDGIMSFQQPYDEYIKEHSAEESELLVDLPTFAKFLSKNPTRLLKKTTTSKLVPNVVSNPEAFGLSRELCKKLKKLLDSGQLPKIPAHANYLFHCMHSYLDTFYINPKLHDFHASRFMYALHAVDHLLKHAEIESKVPDGRCEGLTRPKILILCPNREIAKEIVNYMTLLVAVSNKRMTKFLSLYSLDPETLQQQQTQYETSNKPSDHRETFTGNLEDAFQFGIKYQAGLLSIDTPNYSSDIIVASPLGLRMNAGSEGDNSCEYDFLSSIEVVLCDRLDYMQYQNWSIFIEWWELINKPLVTWHDADINKIRPSALDNKMAVYRQAVFSSPIDSVVFRAFCRKLENRRGFIKLARISCSDYVKRGVKLRREQYFIKVGCGKLKNSVDAVEQYFTDKMLENVTAIDGVLLVLNDETQYLRICQKLDEHGADYMICHEGISISKINLARSRFEQGKIKMLVTTNRLLFFRRYHFKGVARIFLVQPPEYFRLYKDMLMMLAHVEKGALVCLYTKYHAPSLEPICGVQLVHRLVNSADGHVTQFH